MVLSLYIHCSLVSKKYLVANAGYRKRSVDRIRYGFNSYFENEIHEEYQQQDSDDQSNHCPVFFSHTR